MLKNTTTYHNYDGTSSNGKNTVKIFTEDGFMPYDLLFAGLSSCFYSTFQDVLEKKKIVVDKVEIEVTGEKRKEIPMTLTWVKLDIKVYGDVDEEQVKKAADLAAKYCSIHETISKVAEMSHEVSIIRG
ncbi:OsmC family protein [Guggenheimella bovis]